MSNDKAADASTLTPAQRHFIEELAVLLVPWGMPITAARLYGYLQLKEEPVSLDEIVAELEVSKSHVSTAARMLESYGNVRRLGERGTKRVLYVVGAHPGTPLIKQVTLLSQMSSLIARRKDAVASGKAADRLGRLADFHADLSRAMEGITTAERFQDPE
ncbi:transcriptional regulator [Sphingobium sufflavum]|uniref:GbsR/MarR family transcriptional regulator n=1 Tax=Sphingobium sufflavum TaxID=1129547 RepID=UPI001F461BC3|nr:transcriptional regulator [Sphingobium sufflavum]MCE7797641.1 transcriptional regulator [Sphingobium sufflavum]